MAFEVVKDAIDEKIKKETAVHLFKGFDYITKNRWNEVLAEADKSDALDPKYVRAYTIRGNLTLVGSSMIRQSQTTTRHLI